MSGVVVVGAAGFGRETCDVLEAQGRPIAGVLDDGPADANLERLQRRGIPYLGTVAGWLAERPEPHEFLIGINLPPVRRRISDTLAAAGHRATTAIHPSVTIGSSCTIAEGVVILAGARLTTNIHLGRHVHLNPNVAIGHDTTLEDFVSINPAACISGDVRIESGTVVGAQATILQGLVVGPDVLVGAVACVTKDVPASQVVVGVPGRFRPRETA